MKADVVFPLENAGWPALLVDVSATIVRANPAAVKVFGQTLEGSAPLLSAIWTPENEGAPEQFIANWERAPSATVNLKLRAKGGSASAFSISICPFMQGGQKYFVWQMLPEGVVSDASQAHKQKLDCALQLARTVSLDFNNALTTILGHTSLLLSKIEPNHPWRGSLLEVEKSASKAAEIADDLGTFSLQDKETRTQSAGNLNLILQHAVEVFQRSPGLQINWTLQLERKLFAAKFEEAKIQQAFVKILENAVQAVTSDGRISVISRNVELAGPSQDRNVQLAPGTHVCVEISDNGCGIAPDVLPRVFEPFFTTKKSANHRGLGLAWVYGIVTNHGGGVAISSQPGAGTSVRIYLPAEKHFVRDSVSVPGDLGGSQTILMVDDEDLLLTMGETVLSVYGYHVLIANSGAKALEIISQSETPVDLLITDLVMPTMSGRELVEHVREASPTTRIICTSGFVGSMNRANDAHYLQKPFTSQELLAKVKQIFTTESTLID